MREILTLQPHDDDGPVFAEPWQAEAFALAVRLSEAGVFTWAEWAATLGEEISRAGSRGDPDLGDTYYEHWLRALERLITEKAVLSTAMIEERTETWRRAYLATPHGKPVEIEAGLRDARPARTDTRRS